MRILALEPYYGGSHRAFLDGLISHSKHRFETLTLPARKWKWRMRGAAIWFARQADQAGGLSYDLVFATDMVSVADWRALCPSHLKRIPVVSYFHENQISYPLENEADRDFQYGFTNITTCLASDAIWFNSAYHRDEFCKAADRLLRLMPDHVPEGIVENIIAKSEIMHPGISLPQSDPQLASRDSLEGPVSILWNHRWEYDKNPEAFFEAMIKLDQIGLDFDLYVAGERYRTEPAIFAEAKPRLSARIRHWGYASSPREYHRILQQCDVVVSTAIHEFYGLSILEAVASGCLAILPDRLSYPGLFSKAASSVARFYTDAPELLQTLSECIAGKNRNLVDRDESRAYAKRFAWDQCIQDYDEGFAALVGSL